jgi:2-polyprenyl-3-methyl-5-hydroxy-6-metoxy-1,4-benzoquinol methylase
MKNILQKDNSFELTQSINLDKMRPKGFHKKIELLLSSINKIVSSKSGWVNVPNCPICGDKKFNNWMKKNENFIRQCKTCTHGYVSRRPKKISEAYENEEHKERSLAIYDKMRTYRMERFAKERVNLLKKYKKKGMLIDFGCGTGWFLEYARNHYKVAGFEPTKNLAKFTSDLLKIQIESDVRKFKDNSFDIITAFDVIEHVAEPRKTFQEFFRLLKKDGILLIYTPNADSIGFDYMKERQNNVTPPIHLHYFNKKSINRLAQNSFSSIYFKTAGLDIGDIYAHERDNGNGEFGHFLHDNYQVLQTFFDHMDSGNHLRVIFRKN